MKRTRFLALGLISAICGGIVFMGWLGTADIAHRSFDAEVFLLSALLLFYLWVKAAKPPAM